MTAAAEPLAPVTPPPQAPAALTVTDLLLLLMALIWGVNFIVVKFATGLMAPLAFTTSRVVLAVMVLWALVLLRRLPLPGRRDVLGLLTLGMLGNGMYQIFFIEGIARTRASDASLLLAASPAIIEIIRWLRGEERAGWRGLLGIALSLAGIALVATGGSRGAAGNSSLIGNALILGGCVSWSLYSVLLKPYTDRVDGVTLSAVTMSGGLLPILAVAAPSLAGTRWSGVSALAWSAIAYSGLIALVVAYLFWYRGVKMLGPTRTMMYGNVQPFFAMLAAWAVLGEVPHLAQVGGAAFIMTGLLMTRIPVSSTPPGGE